MPATLFYKLPVLSITALVMVMGLALAATASAEPPKGFYFTPKIGYSHMKYDATETYHSSEDDPDPPEYYSRAGSKGQVALGLAIGYDFKQAYDVPIRTEFEYTWRGKHEKYKTTETDGDTIDITTKLGAQSFFLNAYFDIYNSTPVTPYIGAGLGLARVSGEYEDNQREVGLGNHPMNPNPFKTSETKTNFAWNIGAGVAWKITDLISMDLGYRYADFGKVGCTATGTYGPYDIMGGLVDSRATTHEVLLGLRFTF